MSEDYLRFNMDPSMNQTELGGSRMERKSSSLWKNFLLLTVGSLLALHLNVSQAADDNSGNTSSDASESCTLEVE